MATKNLKDLVQELIDLGTAAAKTAPEIDTFSQGIKKAEKAIQLEIAALKAAGGGYKNIDDAIKKNSGNIRKLMDDYGKAIKEQKEYNDALEATKSKMKGLDMSFQNIANKIGAAVSSVGKLTSMLGVATLGFGDAVSVGTKYQTSLFNLMKVQDGVGKGMGDIEKSMSSVTKTTNLSRIQFVDFAETVMDSMIGVKMSISEVENLSASLAKIVGPSLEAQKKGAQDLLGIQSQFPSLYKEMRKGMDLVIKIKEGKGNKQDEEQLKNIKEQTTSTLQLLDASVKQQTSAAMLLTPISKEMEKQQELLIKQQDLDKQISEAKLKFFESILPLLKAVTAITSTLIGATGGFIGIFVVGASVLLGTLPKIVEGYKLVQSALAGTTVGQILSTAAQKAWSASCAIGTAIGNGFRNAVAAIGRSLLMQRAIQFAVTGATKAWNVMVAAATAAQWAWNIALDANPIGVIILAIAAVVAGIALLIKGISMAISWFKNKNKEAEKSKKIAEDSVKIQKEEIKLTVAEKKKYDDLNLSAELSSKTEEERNRIKLENLELTKSESEAQKGTQIGQQEANVEMEAMLKIINKSVAGYESLVGAAEKFGMINKSALRGLVSMAGEAANVAEKALAEQIKNLSGNTDIKIKVSPELDTAAQSESIIDQLTKQIEELDKIGGREDERNAILQARTLMLEKQKALIESTADQVQKQANVSMAEVKQQENITSKYEARLDTERKLMESAQFGLGASITMMQKQVDLAYKLKDTYDKTIDKRKKDVSFLSKEQREQIENASTQAEVEEILNRMGIKGNKERAAANLYASDYQDLTKKSMDQQQKIYDLTKNIREGYLDSIREMSVGAGEFEKIIGTQTMGTTQLMDAVDKFSKGALNTMKLGGRQSSETTMAGIGTGVTGGYSADPNKPMASFINQSEQNARNARIYGYGQQIGVTGEKVGSGVAGGREPQYINAMREGDLPKTKAEEIKLQETATFNALIRYGRQGGKGKDASQDPIEWGLAPIQGEGRFSTNEQPPVQIGGAVAAAAGQQAARAPGGPIAQPPSVQSKAGARAEKSTTGGASDIASILKKEYDQRTKDRTSQIANLDKEMASITEEANKALANISEGSVKNIKMLEDSELPADLKRNAVAAAKEQGAKSAKDVIDKSLDARLERRAAKNFLQKEQEKDSPDNPARRKELEQQRAAEEKNRRELAKLQEDAVKAQEAETNNKKIADEKRFRENKAAADLEYGKGPDGKLTGQAKKDFESQRKRYNESKGKDREAFGEAGKKEWGKNWEQADKADERIKIAKEEYENTERVNRDYGIAAKKRWAGQEQFSGGKGRKMGSGSMTSFAGGKFGHNEENQSVYEKLKKEQLKKTAGAGEVPKVAAMAEAAKAGAVPKVAAVAVENTRHEAAKSATLIRQEQEYAQAGKGAAYGSSGKDKTEVVITLKGSAKDMIDVHESMNAASRNKNTF